MASAHPPKDPQRPETGGRVPSGPVLLLPTLLPVGLLLLAMLLPGFMFQSDQTPSEVGLGPAAWPKAMLMGMAGFCALWIARDIWALGGAKRGPTLSLPQEDQHYHFGKALGGLMIILIYGWCLPILGFGVSTCLFMAIWCLFGGLRNPWLVLPVALIGTIALLWLFMGLALMPLPRGQGVFGDFSIWLLRATGIY